MSRPEAPDRAMLTTGVVGKSREIFVEPVTFVALPDL
jgi:hypothetical protein